MPNLLTIWNTALIHVGSTNTLSSPEENSKEGNVLRTVYEAVRDETLEAAPWPFATRRVALQLVGTPPAEWAYRYRYPTDCLTARRILDGSHKVFAPDERIPYSVEEDEASGAKVILTDRAQAVLEYTARIVKPQLFSPLFAAALSWGLAVNIGPGLAANPKFGVTAGQQYAMAIERAFARALAEGQEDQLPDSEFTRARL